MALRVPSFGFRVRRLVGRSLGRLHDHLDPAAHHERACMKNRVVARTSAFGLTLAVSIATRWPSRRPNSTASESILSHWRTKDSMTLSIVGAQ
jgi:hypothetical protein